MGVITLMGSGETSPTMVKVHRRLLDRFDAPRALLLDTPYGFQENADLISARIVDYFDVSLQQPLGVASYRAPSDVAGGHRALDLIARSDYIFSGPGSPSYALRAWLEIDAAPSLVTAVQRGAALTVASAAAVTVGLKAMPVYEMYKVGEEPFWLDGLDLLGPLLGIRAVAIPHFDNAEGGNHDTRFCYVGQRRLDALRELLDDGTAIIGVDEHTAVSFDGSSVRVVGRGGLTVLHGASEERVEAGDSVEVADLMAAENERTSSGPSTVAHTQPSTPRGVADHALEAISTRDDRAAAAAVLELARRADAAANPRAVLAPLVDALVTMRAEARLAGRWEEADRLRAVLAGAGIEVRDQADGVTWRLPD